MTEQAQWYVKRGEQVRGPFTAAMLKKVAQSGRLRETDQLSKDQENWKLAKQFPKLFTPPTGELLLKDDERSGYDRREQSTENRDQAGEKDQQYRGPDRRKEETPEEVERRKRRTNLLQSIRASRPEDRFPYAAIVGAVLLFAIAGVMLRAPNDVVETDCSTLPAPGVNWDNCQLEKLRVVKGDMTQSSMRSTMMRESDLRGTRLTASVLSYADLSNSRLNEANFDLAELKGTNLRGSDLTETSFVSADLSYADMRDCILDETDFTGARLDNAIMPNGKVCARGSEGTCL